MNLTGHDLNIDYNKVDQVASSIEKISSSTIEAAKSNVSAAAEKVNKAAEKSGASIPIGDVESVFSEISSSSKEVAAKLLDKAETVRIYSQAPGWKKVLSTTAMVGVNLGEGFLSVGDDIVDAVASIGAGVFALAGWDSAREKAEWLIKNDGSKWLANKFYQTDFAKASAFTEDSAIAGALKIAGKTAGYLYLGGVASNAKILTSGKILSSTTKGATAIGAITGFGAGTKNGLKSGKSTKEALIEGGTTGLIQASISAGAGLAGQYIGKITSGASGAGKSLGEFQGYTDFFTKAGQNTTLSGVASIPGTVVSGIKSAPGTIVSGIKSAPGAIVSGIKSAPGAIVSGIKAAPGAIVSGIKAAPGAIGTAAIAAPGVVAQAYRAAKNDPESASQVAQVFDSDNTGKQDDDDENASTTGEENPPIDDTHDDQTNLDPTDPDPTNPDSTGPGQIEDQSGGGTGSGGGGGGSQGSPSYKDPIPPATQPVETPKDDIKPVTPPDSTTKPTPTPTPEPIHGDNPSTADPGQTQITTPAPDTPRTISTNDEGTTIHTGGGYSETSGYTSSIDETTGMETTTENTLEDLMGETTTSIDDIIKGNKYTKIPTSSTPIKTKAATSGGGSAVIPIAAGLSAAAAAGIGAKAYIDRKNNSDNGDEEDYETEEWDDSEVDTINLDYSDDTAEEESYLTSDDAYEGEKYGARTSEELADIQ